MALKDHKRLITWKSGEQEAHYPEDKVKSCVEEIKRRVSIGMEVFVEGVGNKILQHVLEIIDEATGFKELK